MPPGDIYARAFQTAQTGLLLLEAATGRILEANAAFLEMSGWACEDVLGRRFWEPPLVADADAGAEIQAHLRAGGAVSNAELPLQSHDGRWLVLEVNGAAAEGTILLEVRDVTGREQARQAERMETLRSLAARTAGEFRDLHATLLAAGEMLLIAAGQGRPVLRELEDIQHAGERAASIAGQLMAFSGQADFEMRPLALNELLESMLPRLRQLFPPGIEIIPDLGEAAPVMADPGQIRQIVLNLAANARDAMGSTGTFCLQTCNASAVESGLGNPDGSGGPYGMLAVSDSGPGLDDPSWAHLYEPLFSTKPNGQGLGLSAVYGIVRQSGGKLWVYSQPGKGATFRIYLPLAAGQFPALPSRDTRHGDATIVLVEPNDTMRTSMANVLKKCGYRVLAVLDPKEALRVAGTLGNPDLLISRPAPELVRWMAQRQPQLKVLYLGGYTDAQLAQEHGLPPRTALLARPFEPDTLVATVAAMLKEPL